MLDKFLTDPAYADYLPKERKPPQDTGKSCVSCRYCRAVFAACHACHDNRTLANPYPGWTSIKEEEK